MLQDKRVSIFISFVCGWNLVKICPLPPSSWDSISVPTSFPGLFPLNLGKDWEQGWKWPILIPIILYVCLLNLCHDIRDNHFRPGPFFFLEAISQPSSVKSLQISFLFCKRQKFPATFASCKIPGRCNRFLSLLDKLLSNLSIVPLFTVIYPLSPLVLGAYIYLAVSN